jgi:hypothetical protein
VVVRTGENTKEVMVLGIEPDEIIGNTSILERSDQLGEYLVMAFFVFGRLTGILRFMRKAMRSGITSSYQSGPIGAIDWLVESRTCSRWRR